MFCLRAAGSPAKRALALLVTKRAQKRRRTFSVLSSSPIASSSSSSSVPLKNTGTTTTTTEIPSEKRPARVEHCDLKSLSNNKKLSEALRGEITDVTERYFQALIEFGAVYISDELEEDFQLEPNTVKHKMKRIRSDVLLPAGSRHYVRAHVNPRRFLAAGETRWMDCILKETDDFVVVMKPSGLPVSPSVDNAKENVLRCVWSALRVGDENDDEATKLFPTHRLDVTTSGVVVVAKNSKAAGIFSKILRDGFVEKQYLALTENPAKIGLMTHEYEPSERTIGKGARTVKMKTLKLSEDDTASYLKNKTQIPSNVAILRVEKSEPVAVNGKTFYENTVKLITGRTHQIRAQFSKENLALINDCLYLNANDGETAPPRVPEPEEKIGLHALSLKINAETSLGPKGVEFRAENDIWWRSS